MVVRVLRLSPGQVVAHGNGSCLHSNIDAYLYTGSNWRFDAADLMGCLL